MMTLSGIEKFMFVILVIVGGILSREPGVASIKLRLLNQFRRKQGIKVFQDLCHATRLQLFPQSPQLN